MKRTWNYITIAMGALAIAACDKQRDEGTFAAGSEAQIYGVTSYEIAIDQSRVTVSLIGAEGPRGQIVAEHTEAGRRVNIEFTTLDGIKRNKSHEGDDNEPANLPMV